MKGSKPGQQRKVWAFDNEDSFIHVGIFEAAFILSLC